MGIDRCHPYSNKSWFLLSQTKKKTCELSDIPEAAGEVSRMVSNFVKTNILKVNILTIFSKEFCGNRYRPWPFWFTYWVILPSDSGIHLFWFDTNKSSGWSLSLQVLIHNSAMTSPVHFSLSHSHMLSSWIEPLPVKVILCVSIYLHFKVLLYKKCMLCTILGTFFYFSFHWKLLPFYLFSSFASYFGSL